MAGELQVIATTKAPKAIGPYSQAIKISPGKNLVFCSGQLPMTVQGEMLPHGDTIEAEVTKALENVLAVVEAAGGTKEDIVSVQVFLQSIQHFKDFNQAYESFFGDHRPARAVVEVSALPKDARVEIVATAAVD